MDEYVRYAEMTLRELEVSVFDLYYWELDMYEIKQVDPEREPTTLTEYKVELVRIKKRAGSID